MSPRQQFLISSVVVLLIAVSGIIFFIATGGDGGEFADASVSDNNGEYQISQGDIFFQIGQRFGFSRHFVVMSFFTTIALVVISILYFKLEHSQNKKN